MKKLLLYILIFMSWVGIAQTSKVSVKTDTTAIRIGEQFVYAITVDDVENVILPKLENLNGLEVVDTLKTDTVQKRLIQKYIMTGFDSGAFYIPQQQVFIKNQAFLTDSLLVNVATVPVDTTKVKPYAIKGIKSEPYQFDDFKTLIYWIVAIVLLIAVLLYFFVFRKKKEDVETEPVILLSPIEEAMQGLEVLDEKLLWQNNNIKEYYSELTDIVGRYLNREVKIPVVESTSDEMIQALLNLKKSDTILADKETIEKLDALLKHSDLAKFAKSKPMSFEIEGDRKVAEYIIKNIKNKPEEVIESVEEIDNEDGKQ